MPHPKKTVITGSKNREQLKRQIRAELEMHSVREELIKEVKAEMEQEKGQNLVTELEREIVRIEDEFKKDPEKNEDILKHEVRNLISRVKELRRNKVLSKDKFFAFLKQLKGIDD